MAASQENINENTPMGANLTTDGATFRVWAPNALEVYTTGDFNNWQQDDNSLLVVNAMGHWTGFMPGVIRGQLYLYYVVGNGSSGPKRDPYARALTDTDYPWKCIIENAAFPWHD